MSNNEVEATFACIQPGVHVDIKRSNGQTQRAIVSGIDLETKTITVTWSEEGETRGKKLFLKDLLKMNPQLATPNEPANASQQPTDQESLELPLKVNCQLYKMSAFLLCTPFRRLICSPLLQQT
jgi:hypothetical protein